MTDGVAVAGEQGAGPGASAGRLRSSAVAILVTGIVAGVVEMIAVIPIQAALGNGPLRVFQSIASGLEGRLAYAGGLGTAILGAVLHLVISIGAAAVFHLASRYWPEIRRRAVISGLAYGVVVWAVMQWVVLPLSAVAYPPATDPAMVALSISVHALFFGLPLSLLDRRFQQGTGLSAR